MTLDNDRGDEPRPGPGSGSSAPATHGQRRVGLVVALLIGVFVLLAIGDLLVHRAGEVSFGRMLYGLEGVDAIYVQLVAFVVVLGPLMAVGVLLAVRRPRNPIGWLLCAGAVGFAFHSFSLDYWELGSVMARPPPGWTLIAWMNQWLGPLLFAAFASTLLLFPDGRLPSPRWRPAVFVAGGLLAGFFTSQVFMPGPVEEHVFRAGTNPVGVPAAEPVLRVLEAAAPLGWTVLIVTGVAAVAVRFRRARGVERAQLKWVTFAVVLLVAMVVILALDLSPVPLPVPRTLVWSLPAVVPMAVPLAIGLAVLRYRLYEIDRIISRTVSYGLVLVVLGAVYVTVVVGLGAAVSGLAGQEGSDLVVAASVLAVVALFRPVRSRVQTAVDRRFNRTGYQARRAVDAFTEGLREEVDARAIQRGLVATATTLAQPDHLSVWIPARRAEP